MIDSNKRNERLQRVRQLPDLRQVLSFPELLAEEGQSAAVRGHHGHSEVLRQCQHRQNDPDDQRGEVLPGNLHDPQLHQGHPEQKVHLLQGAAEGKGGEVQPQVPGQEADGQEQEQQIPTEMWVLYGLFIIYRYRY